MGFSHGWLCSDFWSRASSSDWFESRNEENICLWLIHSVSLLWFDYIFLRNWARICNGCLYPSSSCSFSSRNGKLLLCLRWRSVPRIRSQSRIIYALCVYPDDISHHTMAFWLLWCYYYLPNLLHFQFYWRSLYTDLREGNIRTLQEASRCTILLRRRLKRLTKSEFKRIFL